MRLKTHRVQVEAARKSFGLSRLAFQRGRWNRKTYSGGDLMPFHTLMDLPSEVKVQEMQQYNYRFVTLFDLEEHFSIFSS